MSAAVGERKADPLSVMCPRCKACIGLTCWRSRRLQCTKHREPHAARVRRAAEEKERERNG